MKLLSVEPARYGRDEAGHNSVSTTNQPADARHANAADARWRSRRRTIVGATTT